MAALAMASAPRRERMNASVRTCCRARSVTRSAAAAIAERRTGAPFSPRRSVSSGSQNATVTAPCGDASSVTAVAGAPISRAKCPAGSADVADAPMNTVSGRSPR